MAFNSWISLSIPNVINLKGQFFFEIPKNASTFVKSDKWLPKGLVCSCLSIFPAFSSLIHTHLLYSLPENYQKPHCAACNTPSVQLSWQNCSTVNHCNLIVHLLLLLFSMVVRSSNKIGSYIWNKFSMWWIFRKLFWLAW